MEAKALEKAEQQGLSEFFKLTSKISTSNMMCFDLDGKIKKYNSPEDIIEDFFPVRLEYYQKRKVCLTQLFEHAAILIQSSCRTSLRMSFSCNSRS